MRAELEPARTHPFHLRSVIRQVKRFAQRALLRNRVLLVSDDAGWVVDTVAESLRENLPSDLRSTVITGAWQEARDCTIHFINRAWAWADGVLDGIHPSSRLIGLWWHGVLNSPEANIQAALDRVRRLHPRFARMHVTCSVAKETMLAVGVPEGQLVLLPMGVDVMRFRPPRAAGDREWMRHSLGVPSEAIVIGCFQKDGEGWGDGINLKWIKGPDLLVDVLARLAERYPVYAIIPGPARGYLRDRLKRVGVPYRSPGFVSRETLPHYYHALDIYISPSRDEGGPAGVLESMASGVPVVSTRAGMPVDILEHGVNGFLVDVDDVSGLVAYVAELVERPSLRRTIAERALQTIRRYDWPVLGHRYADELYRPLMAGRTRGGSR